jgi:LmbE family N-acetylglucosaminyl deacetylase
MLLTPHADDETLFACYTLLRERPLVVLCLPGAERHGSFAVRLAEFKAAMKVVGCDWVSLAERSDELEDALRLLDSPEHVWAPLPEPDGNTDHNIVGDAAASLWPDRVTFYTTYTPWSRTMLGRPVSFDPSWPDVKRRALACYRSQQESRLTRPHFERPLDEYETQPIASVL